MRCPPRRLNRTMCRCWWHRQSSKLALSGRGVQVWFRRRAAAARPVSAAAKRARSIPLDKETEAKPMQFPDASGCRSTCCRRAM